MITILILLAIAVTLFVFMFLVQKKELDEVSEVVVNLVGTIDSLESRLDSLASGIKLNEELIMQNHYRMEEIDKNMFGKYSKDFRDECLELVKSGISIREVSRTKDIPYSTLRLWTKTEKICTQELSNE